jgi:hypothetical protein
MREIMGEMAYNLILFLLAFCIASACFNWSSFVKKIMGYMTIRFTDKANGVIVFAAIRQLFWLLFLAVIILVIFLLYLRLSATQGIPGTLVGKIEPCGELSARIMLRPSSPPDALILVGFFFAVFAGIFASRLVDNIHSFTSSMKQDIAYRLLNEINRLLCNQDEEIGSVIGSHTGAILTGNVLQNKGIIEFVKAVRRNRGW